MIDNVAHTVDIEVDKSANLSSISPGWTLSDGATSNPPTATTGDYSSPYTITVTAEDGSVQDWVVTMTQEGSGGGTTTVVHDGTQATAILNLVVDGITYDVEFLFAVPSEIYGAYPGTYTFNTKSEAATAIEAANVALNGTIVALVGEEGQEASGRYRVGYLSFEASGTENTWFKLGWFEPASWNVGLEETNLYNADPVTFAKFTKK